MTNGNGKPWDVKVVGKMLHARFLGIYEVVEPADYSLALRFRVAGTRREVWLPLTEADVEKLVSDLGV